MSSKYQLKSDESLINAIHDKILYTMELVEKDEELISNLYAKDEKALLTFYNHFQPQVFRFIHRQIRDYSKAEELTQDVFLDFIERIRDFNKECSIKTYLFSIARNKIIDTIRAKKIKKILFSALPPYFVEGLKTILMDEEIEKKELAKKIKEVFSRLPNDYQLVLRLKYIEEEKVKVIAEKLSLGFKATESLIFRARRAFVKIFSSLP